MNTLIFKNCNLYGIEHNTPVDLGIISKEEKMIAENINSAERKKAFLYGRHCISQNLKKNGYLTKHVLKADNGAPIWGNKIKGSITHSKNTSLICIAKLKSNILGVGIDLELANRKLRFNILKKIQNNKEFKFLTQYYNEPYFTVLVFSIKEAVMKAFYSYQKIKPFFKDIFIESITKNYFRTRVTLLQQKVIKGFWEYYAPFIFCAAVF